MSTLDTSWRKATRSMWNGQCVEARFINGIVEVRNSLNTGGGTVSFTADEWNTFIAAVAEDGEFRLS